MKRFHVLMLLVLFAVLSAFGQQQSVSAGEFKKVTESGRVILIDVRSPAEVAQGHIDKAINIDLSDPQFEAKVKQLTVKNKTVALYCRSGRRSKAAMGIIKNMNLKVYELSGGIIEWQQAGYSLNQ
jgi:rhodanese-related sulfurtransferase